MVSSENVLAAENIAVEENNTTEVQRAIAPEVPPARQAIDDSPLQAALGPQQTTTPATSEGENATEIQRAVPSEANSDRKTVSPDNALSQREDIAAPNSSASLLPEKESTSTELPRAALDSTPTVQPSPHLESSLPTNAQTFTFKDDARGSQPSKSNATEESHDLESSSDDFIPSLQPSDDGISAESQNQQLLASSTQNRSLPSAPTLPDEYAIDQSNDEIQRAITPDTSPTQQPSPSSQAVHPPIPPTIVTDRDRSSSSVPTTDLEQQQIIIPADVSEAKNDIEVQRAIPSAVSPDQPIAFPDDIQQPQDTTALNPSEALLPLTVEASSTDDLLEPAVDSMPSLPENVETSPGNAQVVLPESMAVGKHHDSQIQKTPDPDAGFAQQTVGLSSDHIPQQLPSDQQSISNLPVSEIKDDLDIQNAFSSESSAVQRRNTPNNDISQQNVSIVQKETVATTEIPENDPSSGITIPSSTINSKDSVVDVKEVSQQPTSNISHIDKSETKITQGDLSSLTSSDMLEPVPFPIQRKEVLKTDASDQQNITSEITPNTPVDREKANIQTTNIDKENHEIIQRQTASNDYVPDEWSSVAHLLTQISTSASSEASLPSSDPLTSPTLFPKSTDASASVSTQQVYPNLHPFSSEYQTIQARHQDDTSVSQPSSIPSSSIPPDLQRFVSENSIEALSGENSETREKVSPAQLEQLAQAVYQSVKQRLSLERERYGSSYSVRLF